MGLQTAYSSDQLQPRSHGALCVVLVGLGVTEVNHNAITEELCDEATQALHGVACAFPVGRNDLSQIFRVHARRQSR